MTTTPSLPRSYVPNRVPTGLSPKKGSFLDGYAPEMRGTAQSALTNYQSNIEEAKKQAALAKFDSEYFALRSGLSSLESGAAQTGQTAYLKAAQKYLDDLKRMVDRTYRGKTVPSYRPK